MSYPIEVGDIGGEGKERWSQWSGIGRRKTEMQAPPPRAKSHPVCEEMASPFKLFKKNNSGEYDRAKMGSSNAWRKTDASPTTTFKVVEMQAPP